MATYDEVPALLGKLKQRAIDAYMVRDYAYPAGQMWSIEGDHYDISGKAKVTRPGEDGQGGGDWSGDMGWFFGLDGRKDEEFQGTFDTIRTRIDDAVDKWTANLPKEADIKADGDHAHLAMMKLGITPSQNGGTVNASGPMGGYLNLIAEGLDEMSGQTIEAFKGKFLSQLSRVIANQYAMTVPIGGALRAQENLWREARQDVANTVQEAYDAMESVVNGAGPNWELLFKVVGWAAKGAGLFTSGGLKTATEVVGLGVTILTDGGNTNSDSGVSASQSCDSVLTALEESMKALSERIGKEEKDLQANLDANVQAFGQQMVGYDINQADSSLNVPDAQAANVDIVVINRSIVKGITDTHMPAVADELHAAAESLWKAQSGATLNRPDGIGVQNGAQSFDLIYGLYESIRNLEWEVRAGAKTLDLVIQDHFAADAASQRALDEHLQSVSGGSIWDPSD